MSENYYPYIFDSDKYLSKKDNVENVIDLLSNSTDLNSKFPIDIEGIAFEFTVDSDFQGNLPQIIKNHLELKAIDIEDQKKVEELHYYSKTLAKIGDGTSMLPIDFAPFMGFITKEEVDKLIDFLEGVEFEKSLVNDLKEDFITILKTANNKKMGLLYSHGRLGEGPFGVANAGKFATGDELEENIPVLRLHTYNKQPFNESEIKNSLQHNFEHIH